MDAKLKALKVADLKAILAKAEVQAPAKATKADLIARILESQQAQDAYAQIYEPEEDASEPVVEVEEEPETTAENAEAASEAPAEATPAAPADPELEARRKRAERFGIPLVEPKAKPVRKERPAKGPAKAAPEVSAHFCLSHPVLDSLQDAKKFNERAERFGLKRSAPAETVDPEEAERRKKRAERFGIKVMFLFCHMLFLPLTILCTGRSIEYGTTVRVVVQCILIQTSLSYLSKRRLRILYLQRPPSTKWPLLTSSSSFLHASHAVLPFSRPRSRVRPLFFFNRIGAIFL